MAELSRRSEDVTLYDRIAHRASDARVLWELAQSEDDESATEEVLHEIESLERDLNELEVRSVLGGEFDD
jgi:peptide chain release factor 2